MCIAKQFSFTYKKDLFGNQQQLLIDKMITASRWKILAIGFSLVATCLVVYRYLPANDFIILDDQAYITANPHVQQGLSLDSIIWAFTNTEHVLRIPLTWLSLMLDYQLYGLWYPGFAFTNLLLHSLNTVLLFVLLVKMTAAVWRSALVAALFAIHPLHVESVAWMTNRKDVLYALFWFLAIWVYVDWTRKPTKIRYSWLIALFTAACLSKPMAVTLPAVLLIIDYWPLQRYNHKDDRSLWIQGLVLVKEKVPLLLISLLVTLDTVIANLTGSGMPSLESISLGARFQNACLAYIGYLDKMIYPVDLIIFYPHEGTSLSWYGSMAPITILVVVSAAIVALRHAYLKAGWLWYLVTLLPVIGFTQAGMQAMADRYTYIPLVGPFVMLTWGLTHISKGSHVFRFLFLALAAFFVVQFSAMASRQVRVWKNDETVFGHAVSVQPDNYIARVNLGHTLMQKRQFERAEIHFAALIRIDPEDALGYYQMGVVTASQNRMEEAIGHYRRALAIAPGYYEAHNNIGNVYSKLNRYTEASSHYRAAIRISPHEYLPYKNLGMTMLFLRQMDSARKYLQAALERAPESKKEAVAQQLKRTLSE